MKGYTRKSKTRKALKSIVEIIIKSKNFKVTHKLWRAMKFSNYYMRHSPRRSTRH